MRSISRHITPLVINSLADGHTHTNTHTDISAETISRNQVRAGLQPAHAGLIILVKLKSPSYY